MIFIRTAKARVAYVRIANNVMIKKPYLGKADTILIGYPKSGIPRDNVYMALLPQLFLTR